MSGFSELAAGSVTLRLSGVRPERLLNLFARSGVELYSCLSLPDGSLRVRLRRRDLARAREIACGAACDCVFEASAGSALLYGIARRRWVFAALLFVWLTLTAALSLFVWEIEVSGNSTVTDAQILSVLAENGVGIGSFGPLIERERTRSLALEKLPQLVWLTVNVRGSRMEVIVRERLKAPEIRDKRGNADIVAARAGLIEEMKVYEGAATVKAGDTVEAGELLISGELVSLSGKKRSVHALGEVKARVWYSFSGAAPLSYVEKIPTGEESGKKVLFIGPFRINLYNNSGISECSCDKIIDKKNVALPGGVKLPIGIASTKLRAYEGVTARLDPKEAEAMVKAALDERLAELEGEVLYKEYETRLSGGFAVVTLRAELVQSIGVERELAGSGAVRHLLPLG